MEKITALELVNATRHPVALLDDRDEPAVTIEPSGHLPRVQIDRRQVGVVDVGGVDVPLFESHAGDVHDLPEPAAGRAIIVSRQVLEACPERTDLLMVDQTVLGDDRKIKGAKALTRGEAGPLAL